MREIDFLAKISGGGLIYGKYPRSLEIFIPKAVVKKYGLEKGMKVKVKLEKMVKRSL
ncbi:hypothetical protein ES703_41657 [subsurface metagenome]